MSSAEVSPGAVICAIVEGGSMAPAFRDGDLVLARRTGRPCTGDVIVFRDLRHSRLVVHRVCGEDRDRIMTKGDANGERDPDPVRVQEIVGTVRFRIPGIGGILRRIRQRRAEGPCR